MDESINKISLQDKIKMLERLKKIKEDEIKKKEEALKKEIAELESKKEQNMSEMKEELSKEQKNLDEEIIKAINELTFDERRSYTLNMARVQRKLNFGDGETLIGESALYRIADTILSNQNMKLKESMNTAVYGGTNSQNSISRSYESSKPSSESYSLSTSSYNVDEFKPADVYQSNDRDVNNYSSVKPSDLERIDKDIENRRRSGQF